MTTMIEATIARIKTNVPALKLVDGAAGFQSAAESNPKVTPACFVFLQGEAPMPNMLSDMFVQQKVPCTVGVILVARNLTDAKGIAAGSDMEALRKLVKDQLFGWRPDAAYDPFERGSSNLLVFKDGHMWWQDLYLTSYLDRSVQ
jgi:hypothetical protein